MAFPTILMAPRLRRSLLTCLCTTLLPTLACDGDDAPAGGSFQQQERRSAMVTPPASKPRYEFASGLAEKHADIIAFVRQFLETCLAGDYVGYRDMVSRRRSPETRERFMRTFHAIQHLRIESIEPISVPDLPPPVYLVTSAVEFRPDAKPAFRETRRAIAILVFRELNEWRMAPAPSEWQPDDPEGAAPPADSQPALPDYPWDEQGDG